MSQFVQRENTAPQQNWDSLIAHSSTVADRYSKRNATAARVANQLQANMIALGQKGKATVNASTGRVAMDKDFMDNFVAKKDENLTKPADVKIDNKIIDDPAQQKALDEYLKSATNAEDRAKKVDEFYKGVANGTVNFPGNNLGRNGQLNNQVQDPAKKPTPSPTGNTFIGTGAIDPAIKAAAAAIESGQKPDASALGAVPKLAGTPDPNATSPESVAALAKASGLNISSSEKDTSKESVSTGASLEMDAKNKRGMEYSPTTSATSIVQNGVLDNTQMSLGQLTKLKNFAQIMGSTDGTPMPNVTTQWDELIVQRGNELKAAQAALEPTVTNQIQQGGFKDNSDFSSSGKVDTRDTRSITTINAGDVKVGNKIGANESDTAGNPTLEFDAFGTSIKGNFLRKTSNGTNVFDVPNTDYLKKSLNADNKPLTNDERVFTSTRNIQSTWDSFAKDANKKDITSYNKSGQKVNLTFQQLQKATQGEWDSDKKEWKVEPKSLEDLGVESVKFESKDGSIETTMDIWGNIKGPTTETFVNNAAQFNSNQVKTVNGKVGLTNVGRKR